MVSSPRIYFSFSFIKCITIFTTVLMYLTSDIYSDVSYPLLSWFCCSECRSEDMNTNFINFFLRKAFYNNFSRSLLHLHFSTTCSAENVTLTPMFLDSLLISISLISDFLFNILKSHLASYYIILQIQRDLKSVTQTHCLRINPEILYRPLLPTW